MTRMSKVKGETERRAGTEEHAKDVGLVFEEGVLESIALVGAYPVLEERGYGLQNTAGVSARAVAALVATTTKVLAVMWSLSMAPVAFAVTFPTERKEPEATRTSD